MTYHLRPFLFVAFIFCLSLISCKKEITFTTKAKPEVVLEAGGVRLSANDIHLVKDTVYILAGNLVRNTGQSIVIDAGTLIKVRGKFAVDINPGGKIDVNGTQDAPVVFTVEAQKGAAGKRVQEPDLQNDKYWYGISVTGTTALSSGSLNFVRIEFAGGRRNLTGEASLALYNVDKLTSIQNVQVNYSYDLPAFSFSGGNVNAINLVSYASSSNDFVLEGGYTGNLQNVLAYRHPYFAPVCNGTTPGAGCNGLDLAGMIINGDNTLPVISNLTILGPGTQAGTGSKYFDTSFLNGSTGRVAGLLVRGGKFYIRNSVISGFPKTGLHIDNRASAVALNFDNSEFSYSITQCSDSNRAFYLTPNIYRPNTSADFRAFILRPQYNNEQWYNFNDLSLTDPFNYDVNPDPSPKAGSPLLTGANFDGANSFFKRVEYRGAIGTVTDNWLQGWTNFIPLQTDYNN